MIIIRSSPEYFLTFIFSVIIIAKIFLGCKIIHHIIIFAGHYGSGKTMLAVNYAIHMNRLHPGVVLCDLDIVNPYFRAADFAPVLALHGIEVVSSDYANSNFEAVNIPSGMQAVLDDAKRAAVIDLGGDDQGARALGRYAKRLLNDKRYEMLLVVNPFRPLTRGADEIIEIKNEIEQASGIPFTGLAGNPNLGAETSLEVIEKSIPLLESISSTTGLPLVFTAADRQLLNGSDNYFPIEIMKKPNWKVD
jgi:hypothetical protein